LLNIGWANGELVTAPPVVVDIHHYETINSLPVSTFALVVSDSCDNPRLLYTHADKIALGEELDLIEDDHSANHRHFSNRF
jgi:hypothetical protein